MARRPHTKSRHGCRDCKRRHIKCDETKPTCLNCSTARRRCSYAPKAPLASHAPDNLPTPPAETPCPGTTQPTLDVTNHHPLNLRHLHLLSHFLLKAGPESALGIYDDDVMVQQFMPIITATPYLMYEILAFSALHLGCTGDAQRSREFRDEAIILQTEALRTFQSLKSKGKSEVIAEFIFAGVLGTHMLADIVHPDGLTTDDFLDKFVVYMNVYRGVRAIGSQAWEEIRKSICWPTLKQSSEQLNSGEAETSHLDHLWTLIDESDMSEQSLQALRDSVKSLHMVAACEQPGRPTTPVTGAGRPVYYRRSPIYTWPVLVSSHFTELLMKRAPEALIILAHYAALLHSYSDIWTVGGAGRLLIEPIVKNLGSYWDVWLAWPKAKLGMDES